MAESSSFTSSTRDARMKLSQFPFFSWNGIWNGPTLHFTLKPIKTLCVLARFVFPAPCALPWPRDDRESRGGKARKRWSADFEYAIDFIKWGLRPRRGLSC